MKKWALFFTLLSVLFAVSCKKDKSGESGGFDFTIVSLSIDEKYSSTSMLITDDSKLIPVTISSSTFSGKPAPPVTLTEDAQVSCDPEDVVECQLTAEGILVTPKKVGKTTLTVSPKVLSGLSVTCEVEVTDTPTVPVSVSIDKTGTSFSGNVLQLMAGKSFDFIEVYSVTNKTTTGEEDYLGQSGSVMAAYTYRPSSGEKFKLRFMLSNGVYITTKTVKVP